VGGHRVQAGEASAGAGEPLSGLGEMAVAGARRLSVAPMMDWTDRHFRYMMRLITRRTLLYTEMVNMNALIRGDRHRHLDFSPEEHPVSLQLGGDDPRMLATCARLAAEWGYDEVNLNVGCPSERVQNGNFGACLMADPVRVRDCLAAMAEAAPIPVTVKHRIGIDDQDSYEHLSGFVSVVAGAGPSRFTVHARKAWLSGLSPRENREIPPLRYDDVYRLKRDFPELVIELNGGVREVAEIDGHLRRVDAVMVGRAAYENPFLLTGVDSEILGEAGATVSSRREIVEGMLPYIERRLHEGTPLNRISRHMLGLFNGQPGAKAWRRHLSEHAHLPQAGVQTVLDALGTVPEEVASARPGASGPLVAA
jgi:tRNA-dihydrouridine synthase A